MSHTIDEAIEALRRLPQARQRELAGYILKLASEEDGAEDVDAEHIPAVLEGLEQIARGERATEEEVEAAYRSFDE